MSVTCYHRLRKPGGGFGPITAGELPAGVQGECEGVVWMQLPGRRMAVRGELWSEVEGELPEVYAAGSEPHTRDGVDSELLTLPEPDDDEDEDEDGDDDG